LRSDWITETADGFHNRSRFTLLRKNRKHLKLLTGGREAHLKPLMAKPTGRLAGKKLKTQQKQVCLAAM